MKRDALPSRRAIAAPDADAAWHALRQAACRPYRAAGRWAWYWARGKLAHDPVFRSLLEQGRLQAAGRVVDIGCGQGLLASLLQACAEASAQGAWPAAWRPAPAATAYTGIDLMPREIRRAQAALHGVRLAGHEAPAFVCADMRRAPLPACDVLVILDVLHYVDHAAQHALLLRVRAALADRQGDGQADGQTDGQADGQRHGAGRLLLRVGDAAHRRGFAVSQWVDRVVTAARGHRSPPSWGRPLAEWVALLQGLGFVVQALPMSQGTPFANVLLVADLPAASGAAP